MTKPALVEHASSRSASLTVRPARDAGVACPPLPLTSFVGREREVADLADLLARPDVRLVTLTGPGGVGKTRLALRVAADIAGSPFDPVVFVPLASVVDPAVVPAAVGDAFGIRDATPRDLPGRLGALLRGRPLLLVVDNVEHLEVAAPVLPAILAAVPGSTILATSRVILRVSGEHPYPVPPLAVPPADAIPSAASLAGSEAVRLFVTRAAEARPEFVLTDANAATVAGICRQLDGLPLALELAAARVRVLPPEALLARLDRRLSLLTGGPRDQPARLRTLREAISWSHDLLSPAEKRLFAHLAVFAGGFALGAATAVVAETADRDYLLDGLSTLVDASLIGHASGDSAEPRFGMLETIREFGLECLAAAGEAPEVRRRHSAWVLDLVEAAWPPRAPAPDDLPALVRLDRERGNIRAALAWAIDDGDAGFALRLTGALAEYWWLRGDATEGRAWLERALSLPGGSPGLRAAALYGASGLADSQGDQVAALALAEESLALASAHGEALDRLRAHILLAGVTHALGDAERGGVHVTAAHALAQQLGDRGWLGYATIGLGYRAHRSGDQRAASAYLEEAVGLFSSGADRWGEANAAFALGLVRHALGDRAEAARQFARSIALGREIASPGQIVRGSIGLAAIAADAGRAESAARWLGAAEALGERAAFAFGAEVRALRDAAAAQARRALGDERFRQARHAGSRLTLEDTTADVISAAAVLADNARSDTLAADPSGLTTREQEVLQLLVAGHSNPEIAAALCIGRGTVRNHVSTILGKLGARSRTEAADRAHRAGLVAPRRPSPPVS